MLRMALARNESVLHKRAMFVAGKRLNAMALNQLVPIVCE